MTEMITGLDSALRAPDASTRLQAALAAGTRPADEQIDVLIARCAVEPDFFVRDMLTWALVRHDHPAVVDRLLVELDGGAPQARSQALHTLSKIGDPRAWEAITAGLLRDADDETARAAWRTAAGLVPTDRETWLAAQLASQLGRGDRDLRLSLSRAFADLGPAALPAVDAAAADDDPEVRAHALATARLMSDPEEGFDAALAEARKAVALRGAPSAPEGGC